MPERRIQTTSQSTSQTTSQSTVETTCRTTTRTRSRAGRETMARPSELLDGHDMVVTTFHLISDGLQGAPPSVATPVTEDVLIDDGTTQTSARHASSPAIERWHADVPRSRS